MTSIYRYVTWIVSFGLGVSREVNILDWKKKKNKIYASPYSF